MFKLIKNLLLIAALSGASSAIAESFVWKISKGSNQLFLGGTIHLLSKQDYPLPLEFELAYQQSQLLVFEIEPDLVNSSVAQQKFLEYALYTDGTTLSDVLDKPTYQSLNDYFDTRGLSIDGFKTMKPGMLSVVLTVLELQRLGLAGQGVDEFFSEKSKKDNKEQLALETIDDQFRALTSLAAGNENDVIRYSIDEAKRISSVMQKIKSAWRKGDKQALINVTLKPWLNRFPSLYDALLVQRNNRWLPQIESLLTTVEVEYVLVGALHLVGDDGLLTLLHDKGYKIERVTN